MSELITDFVPFAGDRKFGDDEAIVGGFGRFDGESICVIGHEKGSTTEARLKHNFGMARPEGYRKAVRLMEMADRFDIPVLCLVDTAGAYPGIDAEERGQAEAIARSTEACLNLGVPNVAVILGEGGSGGAIAIATANRVLMLEHAIYSVISPEGAASILWHDTTKAQEAATNMKITAQDLIRFGDHRRDHPRAGRRRASRPAGRDRRRSRRRDPRRLRRAQGPRPGNGARDAPGEVPGHRPEPDLRAATRRRNSQASTGKKPRFSAGSLNAAALFYSDFIGFYGSFTRRMVNRDRAAPSAPCGGRIRGITIAR